MDLIELTKTYATADSYGHSLHHGEPVREGDAFVAHASGIKLETIVRGEQDSMRSQLKFGDYDVHTVDLPDGTQEVTGPGFRLRFNGLNGNAHYVKIDEKKDGWRGPKLPVNKEIPIINVYAHVILEDEAMRAPLLAAFKQRGYASIEPPQQ